MKVDAADLVDQGDQDAGAAPSKASRKPPSSLQTLAFLVLKENQQARSPDPVSFREAQRLLRKLTRELKGTPETVLAQVHGLKNPDLVRLI